VRLTKQRKLKILIRMRGLLGKRKGWIQGSYEDYTGGYCLLGAGAQATNDVIGTDIGGDEFALDIAPKLSIIKSVKDRGFDFVWRFTDSKKTRKKDVLALLDEKISELSA